MAEQRPRTFEEGLDRLSQITELLEGGNLPLQETFAAYEEGRILLRELEEMLTAGEKRIQAMEADGSLQDITAEVEEAKEG